MKLTLTKKHREAGDVWSFYFECPEAAWKAGQSIRLELPRPTWGIDERRFTIASAPSEGHIRITTNISGSTFKQALLGLQLGTVIDGHNIEGDFTWEPKGKKLLIAGGIGVTPFRALIKARIDAGKPCDATLIYTSGQDHLFVQDFTKWTGRDSSLQVILLKKRLALGKNSTLPPEWLKRTVYISGPEHMVRTLRSQLLDKKMPMSQIKTDIFTGL